MNDFRRAWMETEAGHMERDAVAAARWRVADHLLTAPAPWTRSRGLAVGCALGLTLLVGMALGYSVHP